MFLYESAKREFAILYINGGRGVVVMDIPTAQQYIVETMSPNGKLDFAKNLLNQKSSFFASCPGAFPVISILNISPRSQLHNCPASSFSAPHRVAYKSPCQQQLDVLRLSLIRVKR